MRHWLISFLLIYSHHLGLGQPRAKYITNYGPEIIKSGEDVYSVTSDKEGVLYFAIARGVLVYDGNQWKTYPLEGEYEARTVEYDVAGDRILVGGLGTFGCLERDLLGGYRYVCLTQGIEKRIPVKSVWQAIAHESTIMFLSDAGIFVVRDDSVVLSDIPYSTFFLVENSIYFSTYHGPLWKAEGNTRVSIWDQKAADGNTAYHISKYGSESELIFYSSGKVFIRNVKSQEVIPFNTRLTTEIEKHRLYTVLQLSDSLLAIGTYDGGILITDFQGNRITQLDTNSGLAADGIWDLEIDRFGKLWVASEYGISVVDLRMMNLGKPLYRVLGPVTKLTSVVLNGDSLLSIANLGKSLSLDRKPQRLRFNFATPGLDFFADHEYEVKLEGYDSTWRRIHNSFLEYSDLPNGDYIFNVRDIRPNYESASTQFAFRIAERWYLTFLDIGKYIGAGVALLVVLVFVTTHKLRSKKDELIDKVNEKTKEIAANQNELIRMNRSLIQVNEELDIFLYRSSHDLVAPIKSIKGLLGLMKLPGENRENYFRMMEDRILKFEALLEEIGAYVKNSKKPAVKASLNVKHLVETVWAEMEFMDEAKRINFEVMIAKDLAIESDIERLKIVISNLVANSIKYHNMSRTSPYVRVSSCLEQASFTLCVEDNGQGIGLEYQERLFDMFYRAHEKSKGSGLGLFLVKKMVERLDGTIKLESKQGVGTKVTILLPV